MYANYFYWQQYNWWEYVSSKQYFDFIWTCTNGGLYWYDYNGNWYDIEGITHAAPSPTYPPPTNTNTKYGFVDDAPIDPVSVVGVPLAWTGSLGMSTNGYASPDYGSYCYVGWEAMSPFMVTPTGYNGMLYKWFPYYFYRYALGIDNNLVHGTVKQSLDYATSMIFGYGYNFGNSKLDDGEWVPGPEGMEGWWYRRMRVFGNGNLILPY